MPKKLKAIMDEDEEKWRVEDDVRTLERAEEIRKDPERMKKAVNMMKDKMDKIKSFVEMNKKKIEKN